MIKIMYYTILLSWSTILIAQSNSDYVLQVLEPTGGKIEKPKDWFYNERHGGPYYIWILSKEDPNDGPYTTGVKIQSIMGIEEQSGKSAEQFLREFVEKKKNQVKTLSQCDAEDQDFFTKICLETIEPAPDFGKGKNFHIQYSLFWGNELDIAIIMIAGTLEELWDENKKNFEVMGSFELIDMKRFE